MLIYKLQPSHGAKRSSPEATSHNDPCRDRGEYQGPSGQAGKFQ